jgi:hypothetical protein
MEDKKWINRAEACRVIGKHFGLSRPLKPSRLMAMAKAGQVEVKELAGQRQSRYFVSVDSVRRLLATKDE